MRSSQHFTASAPICYPRKWWLISPKGFLKDFGEYITGFGKKCAVLQPLCQSCGLQHTVYKCTSSLAVSVTQLFAVGLHFAELVPRDMRNQAALVAGDAVHLSTVVLIQISQITNNMKVGFTEPSVASGRCWSYSVSMWCLGSISLGQLFKRPQSWRRRE